MQQKFKKIQFENLKRKLFLKAELKKKIFKSILQNNSCLPKIKMSVAHKIQKIQKICSKTQHNNICFVTGKYRGILSPLKLSRHTIKKLGNNNEITHLKIKT
jgi:ribosomal protein S14